MKQRRILCIKRGTGTQIFGKPDTMHSSMLENFAVQKLPAIFFTVFYNFTQILFTKNFGQFFFTKFYNFLQFFTKSRGDVFYNSFTIFYNCKKKESLARASTR